ncbi:MAG: sugar nucleotide-binding protein [Deltaproteobacteria bacterium]|nr:sugar nucleotide-binding protein [Deltaproteobacteria bacterium]
MRIVVVGATGLIGRAVVRAGLEAGVDIVGLGRHDCDVTRDREAALRAHRPDAVIFCAAATNVDAAGNGTRAVNVDAPGAWSRQVATWLLSSNFVFDGWGPHAPSATPRPCNTYAAQKVEAERLVLAAGGHVVRVGWVHGPGGKTFASTLPSRLARGETVRAISDVLVQPTRAVDVARALVLLPRGVTHLVGNADTTWYGYASALAARLGGKVEPVRLADFGLDPRPRDARLWPATLPGWHEGIEEGIPR